MRVWQERVVGKECRVCECRGWVFVIGVRCVDAGVGCVDAGAGRVDAGLVGVCGIGVRCLGTGAGCFV